MSGIERQQQELPVDLVAEILLRLEVKHILRCKLLSKTFYALIKSPSFASQHLHRSKTNDNDSDGKNSYVVAVSSNKLLRLLSRESEVHLPPHLPELESIALFGSCNGLLCLLLHPRQRRQGRLFQVLLYNPATREARLLPARDHTATSFGFGYDVLSGDYKVAEITTGCIPPHVVTVWSSSTNTWTEALQNFLPEGYWIYPSAPGLFLDGKLYWMADPRSSLGKILFSISLSDYSLRRISISKEVPWHHGLWQTELTLLRGSLAVFVCEIYPMDCYTEIWVMEDEDGRVSWTKQLSIGPIPNVLLMTVNPYGNFLTLNLQTADLFSYDPCTMKKTKLAFSHRLLYSILWRVDESLVSVQTAEDDGEYTDFHDFRRRRTETN